VLGALAALAEGAGLALLAPLLTAVGVTTGAAGAADSLPFSGLAHFLGFGGLLLLWLTVVASLTAAGAGRDLLASQIQESFVRHLRLRVHAAACAMEWASFQQLRGADVVAVLTATTGRVGLGIGALIQGAATLLVVAAQVAVALATSPAIAGSALAAGAILAVVQGRRVRRAFAMGGAAQRGMLHLNAEISEHMAGMKLARAHGAEAGFTNSLNAILTGLGRQTIALGRHHVLGQAGFRLAAAVTVAAAAWIAVTIFGVAGSRLLILMAVFARLLPAMGRLVVFVRQGTELLPAWIEIESLLSRLSAAAGPPPQPDLLAPAGSLRFDAVGYTYPGRDRAAVDQVTLTVEENRTTALVGPSGAGKSTLADLALGLLLPDHGRITVGGVALDGALRAAWRQGVAYVPQDGFLLHDSVRANLNWGAPAATDADLWRALDMAAAADMVRGLPQGLETIVGDRGVRLSGGERQRLALARALLRQPRFLVLDEATSHLDHDHESLIRDALDQLRGRLTILVIAHRLATVRNADTIAVIDRGRVVEEGGWDTLVAADSWLTAGAIESGREKNACRNPRTAPAGWPAGS
jgi:ATP-binding cassette subfamily C protein